MSDFDIARFKSLHFAVTTARDEWRCSNTEHVIRANASAIAQSRDHRDGQPALGDSTHAGSWQSGDDEVKDEWVGVKNK
ncbi:MAG: hypothetical protein NZ518_04680 [Dehalococcoidia bacterium]|nr:hypothetical protein [Dehalococcoidia bacterium]